jgi:acyl-CoA thioesterase-2
MNEVLADLLLLLDLEPIDTNIFRGANRDEPRRAVFGGQVAAQALMAVGRTVDAALAPHSLHGYFLRPGNPALPILYKVERIRDGKSFVTRNVIGVQKGEAIFSMSASFHRNEQEAFEHQDEMPSVPPPEQCQTREQYIEENKDKLHPYIAAWMMRPRPVELRPTEPMNMIDPQVQSATQRVWVRAIDALPDDPLIHACVAAYASDMSLLGSALRPHARTFFSPDLFAASLDHAVWLHVPFRMDQWWRR